MNDILEVLAFFIGLFMVNIGTWAKLYIFAGISAKTTKVALIICNCVYFGGVIYYVIKHIAEP